MLFKKFFKRFRFKRTDPDETKDWLVEEIKRTDPDETKDWLVEEIKKAAEDFGFCHRCGKLRYPDTTENYSEVACQCIGGNTAFLSYVHYANLRLKEVEKLNMSTYKEVRVGVCIALINPFDRVLIGKRLGSHGAGSYSFPGGHLEAGESFESCALREILEETGIDYKGELKVIGVTNDLFEEEGKHYVTVYLRGDLPDYYETPEVVEPDKCEEWLWVRDIDLEKYKLFLPLENFLKNGDSYLRIFYGK